jgi:hypothetical protein
MIGVLHKLFLAVGLSTGVVVGTQSQNIALADEPGTVLITGSSRGVGFELAKQYAVKEWKVIATCRTPSEADDLVRLAESYPNVIIEEMDVTDVDEIEALAKGYAGTPIDSDFTLVFPAALSRRRQGFESPRGRLLMFSSTMPVFLVPFHCRGLKN